MGRRATRRRGCEAIGDAARKRFVPKGLKDSVWGFNPRYRSKKDAHPHKAYQKSSSFSCSKGGVGLERSVGVLRQVRIAPGPRVGDAEGVADGRPAL